MLQPDSSSSSPDEPRPLPPPSDDAAGAAAPDDLLPPVEPPSAGFLVQLFLVPGVIVAAIVVIWLLVGWVANRSNDPTQYIEALTRPGPGRWQTAVNLSNALRDGRHTEFRANREAAARLAAILKDEIDVGSLEEKPITLRMFLCRALGEFHVDAGLDVLLLAATTERDPAESHVRRSAVEALALLAENLLKSDPQALAGRDDVIQTLDELAEDDDPLVRSTTAFALGVVGSERARDRLAGMLVDSFRDARYNAATGLARNGDIRAVEVLEEMLEVEALEAEASDAAEDDLQLQRYRRAMVLINAMRAVDQLRARNPQADLKSLVRAIERVAAAPLDRQIVMQARDTLEVLKSPRK